MITAALWRPAAKPEAVPLETAETTSDALLVLSVDATLDAAEDVYRALHRVCGEHLTLEMVEDLLDPDELPEVKQFGEGGQLRKVSSFGVRLLEHEPDRDPGLVFEPIEFLAGERWLVRHWQPSQTYPLRLAESDDTEEHRRDDRQMHEDVEDAVVQRWLEKGDTAGDLGVLFLYELALRYSKARKVLWTWFNAWEVDFYNLPPRGENADELSRRLRDLHRLHGELHRRLGGLDVPRNHADRGWFTNVTQRETAQGVDEMVDRSLSNLRSFSDSLRQAVTLTQSYTTLRHFALAEEQTKLAEEQREATQHLQKRFELITALLLVPTLIAGFYGANTSLPGGGHWSGFVAMVTLMVLGSAATYAALRSGSRPDDEPTR